MIELKERRSLNGKHFDLENGKKLYTPHVGHIHYFDKLDSNRLRELDWKLSFDEKKRGWYFNYHSFRPFLPEYADEWVEFRDLFDGKDQTVKYKAACNHVKGRLVDNIKGVTEENAVIYDNAFGEGIDYILYFTRSTLKKVVRIREGFKPKEETYFDFETDFGGKNVKRGNKEKIKYFLDKTREKEFDTDKHTLIGDEKNDGKEWNTYLKPFIVWDEEKIEIVKVKYFFKDGKRYLRKIVSKEFLENSVGDVFTDTTTSYYAGAGDGYIDGTANAVWDTIHDGLTGSAADYTATIAICEVYNNSSKHRMARLFLPIDTSGLPAGASISAADLKTYGSEIVNSVGDDTYDYVRVVQTSQANTSTLGTDDFDQCGSINNPTAGANDTDLDTLSTSAYNTISLNATGISWITDSGVTKLGLRQGHDAQDNEPGVGRDRYKISTSEETGTSQDPYLEITYTEGGGEATKNPLFMCNF